ncbi:MAG TPA: glycerol-3-phosphate dehydrogenase [Acetobacteraceae bacterium]|jgi:glycerol-3-phosphate dehydrogenase|nr:glycerol-3-phosphate dehydrogenase [Acetobacteraceae bacterium]
MTRLFDLAVIGGGINGIGIARDAAGRGLSVLLLEQGDLAGATSSASTKLIHGGLRYLEHYAFRLVRESLAEREVLWRAAPHIVGPLRFVLPHHPGLRPRWEIRAGLFLYDHLGGRKLLPPTRVVDLRRDPAGAPLRPGFTTGFEYSDCWVDDARLVVLNARDAAARGADIRTRTRCTAARNVDGVWQLVLEGGAEAHARVLVNAGGPWVARVLSSVGHTSATAIRLVKGSHIVVPRLYQHDRAYIFQNADGRVCFAIPYHDDFTLIGTTDEDHAGDPAVAVPSAEEERYLCAAVSEYLRQVVDPASIVWRYAGVRPLRDDGASKAQEATRDYVLELQAPPGEAPVLSVFGGKLTTYRRLAEAAMAKLAPFFPRLGGVWTAGAPLPGGNFPPDGVAALCDGLLRRYPFLSKPTGRRLVRSYGTLAAEMLGDARTVADLGQTYGADLGEREVDWLVRTEWAGTAEDILWRRSKLGLRLTADQARDLANAMGNE